MRYCPRLTNSQWSDTRGRWAVEIYGIQDTNDQHSGHCLPLGEGEGCVGWGGIVGQTNGSIHLIKQRGGLLS